MSVNKVILVGNVGKDPETRYLDESTAFTKFPLATSETYKNKSGERVSNTEWHNVVLWRGLAQVAEKYVKKGTQVYIEGRIKTRSYDDADGNKKYITEIVGDQMQLLGKRPDDAESPSGQGSQSGHGFQGNQSGQAPSGSQSGQGFQGGQTQSPAQDLTSGEGAPFDGGDNGPDDLPF
jgi:single-strand DNA-binding protein